MNLKRLRLSVGDGSFKDVSILQQLGHGAFGVVHKVHDDRGCFYALKSIICDSYNIHKSAVQEIRCLSNLQHPNIVKVFAADLQFDVQGKSWIYILLEFCGAGTLNQRLSSQTSDNTNLKWMVQIADALQYLHATNIMHRDLKPDNILLSNEDDIKVADFGLARTFSAKDRDDREWISVYLQAYIGTLAGSPFWMAPEVFYRHYDEKADVFSLGILFFCISERQFITIGQNRFYGAFATYGGQIMGISQVMNASSQKDVSKLVSFKRQAVAKPLKDLILSTLEYHPHNRPTAFDAYRMIQDYFNKAFPENTQVAQSCF